MKIISNSEQAENTKSAERHKTSFPKEQVENADQYKPVLNKIMTTQEQCLKYNFVAPLKKAQAYNISYKLLRPIQFPEKFLEILEWSNLQK